MKRLLFAFVAGALLFVNAPLSVSSAETGIPWVRNSTDACVWVTVEGEKGTFADYIKSHGEHQFRKPEHPTSIRFEFNDPYQYRDVSVAATCRRSMKRFPRLRAALLCSR
jgi:hypothetical protein